LHFPWQKELFSSLICDITFSVSVLHDVNLELKGFVKD